MAWFSKTLKDMESAIEKENWEEAKDILKKHNQYVQTEVDQKVKYDLANMARHIQWYHESLDIVSRVLNQKGGPVGGDIYPLKAKIQEAINSAAMFERILMDLIKISKKLK